MGDRFFKNKSQKADLIKCQVVVDHIDSCMQKFTTNFMVGHHISKGVDGKEIDLSSVVGVIIIEKDVQMTSGKSRSLIHYFMVKPDICTQYIGTAMLKMIMTQPEYVVRKIMAVTKLNHKYHSVVGMKCTHPFFTKFKFTAMKKKRDQKIGVNDVNKIVLEGSDVHCTEQSDIMRAYCNFVYSENAFGYYEIDKHRKYSICVNPHDNHIYANQHIIVG